jgi:hypothetical protein
MESLTASVTLMKLAVPKKIFLALVINVTKNTEMFALFTKMPVRRWLVTEITIARVAVTKNNAKLTKLYMLNGNSHGIGLLL